MTMRTLSPLSSVACQGPKRSAKSSLSIYQNPLGGPLVETPTRERIVTNALRLFAQRGFNGTAVTEIEAAAGLAPGSGGLYTHFHTKEEVLAAAIEHSVTLAEAG